MTTNANEDPIYNNAYTKISIVATFPTLSAACHFLTRTKSIQIKYKSKKTTYGESHPHAYIDRDDTFIAQHPMRLTKTENNWQTNEEWSPAWLKSRFDGRKTYQGYTEEDKGKYFIYDDQRIAIPKHYGFSDNGIHFARTRDSLRFFGIIKYGENAYGILGNTSVYGHWEFAEYSVPTLYCTLGDGDSDSKINTPFGQGCWHYKKKAELIYSFVEYEDISIVVDF